MYWAVGWVSEVGGMVVGHHVVEVEPLATDMSGKLDMHSWTPGLVQ